MEGARVLLLGHGAISRAMEHLLGPRHELTIWDRDLDTWEENVELESVAGEPDFILFTLPTNPHEECARRVASVMRPDCVCLSIAKGLDDAGRPACKILESGLRIGQPIGVIYGPMIARELQQGRAGYAMLGTRDQDTYRRAVELFAGTPLRLEHSRDIIGVSWAVILKNIYVPLIGAADALELGDNVRGFLVCALLRELDAVCTELGAERGSAYTVAGLGDLVTSATSESSHHRTIGADLAAGRTDRIKREGGNIRTEGVHTLAMIEKHGLLDIERYPLMALVRAMLADPDAAGERLRQEVMAWGD